jgi:hypothetical protein
MSIVFDATYSNSPGCEVSHILITGSSNYIRCFTFRESYLSDHN